MSVYMSTAIGNLVDTLSVYTAHRLAADPATARILETWNPEVEKLTKASEALDAAIGEQLRTRALRDWKEIEVRNTLRAFANRVAESGNGSRRTAAFLTYFPKGFSALSGLALDDLVLTGRTILARLESETDEGLRTAGERITAAIAEAEPIVQAYEVATLDVAEKRAALHAARIVWIGAYRRVEGELTALYPQDRSLVRSFFYRRKTARKKETSDSSNGVPEEAQATA